MDSLLRQGVELYRAYIREADKAVVGLERVKEKIILGFLTELATTYTDDVERRVSSGLVWLHGVPGGGKTYIALVIAMITKTRFGRLQGVTDLKPKDIVGAEVFNPETRRFEQRPGPIVTVNILLVDEFTRFSPKAQSAFIEPFQERTVTIGDTTHELPLLSFGIATSNPVETGGGTNDIEAAVRDRFLFRVAVGYPTFERELQLVSFDIKKVRIEPLITEDQVLELRAAIKDKVRLDPSIEKYIARLVRATRSLRSRIAVEDGVSGENFYKEPVRNPSPSALVEDWIDLGAGPRATMYWGRAAKARALLVGGRDAVYPEDVQALAHEILEHRLFLKPSAKSQGVTERLVVKSVLQSVPIP